MSIFNNREGERDGATKGRNGMLPQQFSGRSAALCRDAATRLRRRSWTRGFTMIEIAISLAVIGFALVAIIGILPYGMGVQRENREETIINQEYSILLNAIRNGDRGLDDLTNYVVAITNYQTWYPVGSGKPQTHTYAYTYTESFIDGSLASPPFPITNGFRIVGLLSTPKYYVPPGNRAQPYLGYFLNHVVATIRSMSGTASDKFPQKNPTAQEMAFAYRVTSEVVPSVYAPMLMGTATNSTAWDPDWTNYTAYTNSAKIEWMWRSNYWQYARNLEVDFDNVRLSFNWPAFPNGRLGDGHQSYRAVTAGPVKVFYEPWIQPPPPLLPTAHYALYFVEPNTFVRMP